MNKEMIGGCCVCSDDRGWSENPLVYCDGQNCNVAVHQACYGIVTVPTGPWFCRKCESQERSTKVKCELCPSKYGALKRTDNNGWAHVVCALYIPEVRFGNVTTMEPIQLQLIPPERFNKVCYICEEKGKNSSATAGACMQCNKVGCKYQFHVTCAQSLGLLCEEAGNYLDNVKYCGYCQHHYSKLKKGGNVKTIPPYKPVNDHHNNSDSNSEKEAEGTLIKKESPSPVPGRPGRKLASASKGNNSKNGSANKSGSQSKAVQNSKGSTEKPRTTPRGAKPAETPPPPLTDTPTPEKGDKKDLKSTPDTPDSEKEVKDSKAKKRKVSNSRTPTPVQSEVSVVVSTASGFSGNTVSVGADKSEASGKKGAQSDSKKGGGGGDVTSEKGAKNKQKIETTQSIISNQPIVALTSITSQSSLTSVNKVSSPIVSSIESATPGEVSTSVVTSAPSIIQIAQAQKQDQLGSLVVSVPLASTSITPHNPIINNQTSVVAVTPFLAQSEKVQASSSVTSGPIPQEESALLENASMLASASTDSGVLTHSEMSGGGLKITYEKQADTRTEMDMELEMEMDTPMTESEIPVKRGRSQSNEKVERITRGNKKRNNTSNSMPSMLSQSATMPTKRSSRSQNNSPPSTPMTQQEPGAFAVISQSQIKDSPPSSPSSESQGAPPSRARTKGRKSAPAAVTSHSSNSRDGTPSGSSKEPKDIKLFQNGITTAPHMLGNQLNPNSTMHQKMTEHLGDEINAHSIYHNSTDNGPPLVGPQMHHKIVQSARASSTSSSTASGGSGLSNMLSGGGSGTIPQTLDQLLERQWEQGSQFLMEQAQHFDIASLLSCLHQLRAENTRLEEHVSSLLQRRDHLLAVNARLAIPLTSQPATTPQPPHSHNVNNIHPSLSHGDIPRPPRHNSATGYDRHSQGSTSSGGQYAPVENGLPPDVYPQNPHSRSRSPVTSGQPSPNIRHHSPASYSNNGLIRQAQDAAGLLRQSADTGGRAAPSRQPYPLYDRPGSSQSQHSQQMVISRRDWDTELHHHGNKPS